MAEAGGRLFVDVTQRLASPASRAGLLELTREIRSADPGRARRPSSIAATSSRRFPTRVPPGPPPGGAPAPIETDPAIVTELIARSQASIAALRRDIQTKSGSALLDFILADIQELRRILFDPRSHQVIMAAMEATWWLNEQLQAWLGEKNAADTLTQSVPHNVTSEMGLALLDVADVIRPHPEVVAFLEQVEDDDSWTSCPSSRAGAKRETPSRPGSTSTACAASARSTSRRPRWSERPTTLVPLILGNVKNFEPGAGERRFEQGRQEAAEKEQELLERLRALPDGEQKAAETKRMIDRVRTFIGYREYPKYGMVSRYFVYKQALLRGGRAPRRRPACFARRKTSSTSGSRSCTTSCGRTKWTTSSSAGAKTRSGRIRRSRRRGCSRRTARPIAGSYRRDDLPAGALVGLPVSAGIVEGGPASSSTWRRPISKPGDILVTAYTDPSWTPLFVAIEGLVTEVGGLMTHGAVIAREYGLPAVVGVEHATRLIRDGQRIRVHGTDGYVEILS